MRNIQGGTLTTQRTAACRSITVVVVGIKIILSLVMHVKGIVLLELVRFQMFINIYSINQVYRIDFRRMLFSLMNLFAKMLYVKTKFLPSVGVALFERKIS